MEKKNTERESPLIEEISPTRFLEEGTPIFPHLSYEKELLSYAFSSESVAYFESADKIHKPRKERKMKKNEK